MSVGSITDKVAPVTVDCAAVYLQLCGCVAALFCDGCRLLSSENPVGVWYVPHIPYSDERSTEYTRKVLPQRHTARCVRMSRACITALREGLD